MIVDRYAPVNLDVQSNRAMLLLAALAPRDAVGAAGAILVTGQARSPRIPRMRFYRNHPAPNYA